LCIIFVGLFCRSIPALGAMALALAGRISGAVHAALLKSLPLARSETSLGLARGEGRGPAMTIASLAQAGYVEAANAGPDTRALQGWFGHRNIQHTVRYTELSPTRFKDFSSEVTADASATT
jgi:hypothetical protein